MNRTSANPVRVAVSLYDTPDGKVGGPIAWALDFVQFLTEEFETTALVLRPGGACGSNVAEVFSRKGIRCECLDTTVVGDLNSQVEWIYEQARRFKFDIVISNLVLPALYASEGLRRAGICTIGVLHSHPEHDPFYRDIVDVFACDADLRSPNCLVAVSKQIAQCIPDIASDMLRIEVIPCGTRLAMRHTNQNATQPRLLYAGRLVQFQKRIRATVDSLLFINKQLGFPATIIGNGDQREWVIQRLQGQVGVCYAGAIAPSAIESVYVDHHIFVLLSDFEGLPIALVEAMARGLVPVGLKTSPGINEVIIDGVNGILVGDREASFLTAMKSLQDVSLRDRLSKAARQTVAEQYSHDVTFAQWQFLLNQLAPAKTFPRRIPRRCVIEDRGNRFADYPLNRLPWERRLWLRVMQHWNWLRQTLRPRARFRDMIGR